MLFSHALQDLLLLDFKYTTFVEVFHPALHACVVIMFPELHADVGSLGFGRVHDVGLVQAGKVLIARLPALLTISSCRVMNSFL